MSMRILTLATALTLALAGCASSRGLHPDGQLTDPQNLTMERSLADVKLTPAAWPAQDWWVGLGDPQLSALIDEALKNNPGLAAADAAARLAQAQVQGARAARGPQVALDAAAPGVRLSSKDYSYPVEDLGTFAWAKSATLDFSWGLDLWGGKRAAWEAALGRSRAAEIDAHAARLQLSVNVARAYIQLGYAFAQQDVADAELQRTGKVLELARRYVTAGLGTPQQLHQADFAVASAQQQKAQVEHAIDAVRSSLSVLLGQGPDRGLQIARPRVLKPADLALPDNLPVELIGRRADLVAARWRVEAAGKEIKAAKTEFLPNISISAMAGFVAVGDSSGLFQLPARTYGITPALSLPIFDGGRRRAHLAATDASYDGLVAQYDTTLVRAVNEVTDNYAALKSMQTQIAAEQRAQQDAQQAWDDALKLYKGGLGSSLETLIARQQLLAAQQRMAALDSQQMDLSVQLIQALGGGYRTENPSPSPSVDAFKTSSNSSSPVR
ncbi:efflux transporter outer membrane subunit [Rhodanobacter sp. C05]|uniref:efflux transporter outer membrane subunit n=1 Tax=Rhodanobacter sp. C05 TaxID=1945855 RepID=UPI0009865C2E|nr:efflux transporter outer membrane subunit [Rhodanobacter sp. C05]OOG38908.1 multidrug RND transporter [Rhodanobacter sp. C05]